MIMGQALHDPQIFIAVLREYHEAPADGRGALANALSDAIVHKRIDLAEVRQALIDAGDHELLDTLDRLLDLIEPYLEGGDTD